MQKRPLNANRLAIAIAVAAAVAITAIAAVALRSDDQPATNPSVTSTLAPSTTVVTPSTTLPTVDEPTAVWPDARSTVRYDNPEDAARGFAEDLVGFTNPIIGRFGAGDSRSGEVPVRAKANGPVTTVLVRQLAGNSWWVLGSVTSNIVISTPEVGATVKSPLQLTGQASAYEGTVDVELREDGNPMPLATTFVTGSGDGTLGPFEGSVTVPDTRRDYGALILKTESAEDGSVWEANVLRVRLR